MIIFGLFILLLASLAVVKEVGLCVVFKLLLKQFDVEIKSQSRRFGDRKKGLVDQASTLTEQRYPIIINTAGFWI